MPYSKKYANICQSLFFLWIPSIKVQTSCTTHTEEIKCIWEAICPAPAKGDSAWVRLDHVRKALPCANDRWIMSTDTVAPAPAAHTHTDTLGLKAAKEQHWNLNILNRFHLRWQNIDIQEQRVGNAHEYERIISNNIGSSEIVKQLQNDGTCSSLLRWLGAIDCFRRIQPPKFCSHGILIEQWSNVPKPSGMIWNRKLWLNDGNDHYGTIWSENICPQKPAISQSHSIILIIGIMITLSLLSASCSSSSSSPSSSSSSLWHYDNNYYYHRHYHHHHQCYIVLHCQFLALILTKLLYVIIILVLDAPVWCPCGVHHAIRFLHFRSVQPIWNLNMLERKKILLASENNYSTS